jgi:hypothetical protein
MTISILVEPSQVGFRATTGGPLELAAEASSAAEAVNALQEMIAGRLGRGAVLIDYPVHDLGDDMVKPRRLQTTRQIPRRRSELSAGRPPERQLRV